MLGVNFGAGATAGAAGALTGAIAGAADALAGVGGSKSTEPNAAKIIAGMSIRAFYHTALRISSPSVSEGEGTI